MFELRMTQSRSCLHNVGDKMVHSRIQLSKRWPCHMLFVGKMKFASFDAHLGEDGDF